MLIYRIYILRAYLVSCKPIFLNESFSIQYVKQIPHLRWRPHVLMVLWFWCAFASLAAKLA